MTGTQVVHFNQWTDQSSSSSYLCFLGYKDFQVSGRLDRSVANSRVDEDDE
jgi:hypothetical protein